MVSEKQRMGKYELRSKKRQRIKDEDDKDPKKSKGDKSRKSSTRILDLNDDCFDEIFGYLSYADVLSTSQVCMRFENRAQAAFKRNKYNLELFSIRANAPNTLLRHIGPALLKLELYFGQDVNINQQIIDMTTKYCIENLTEITLHCLTNRNKLRKSFSQVNKLTLSFCDLVGRFKLMKWFPNLTNLTYHYTRNLTKFMKQKIPTMHTLNINCIKSQSETITMLKSNPQIKVLSLHFVADGGLVIRHSLLTAIDEALPELQKLNLIVERVNNFEIQDSPLYFKQLKALKIENDSDYPNTSLINHLGISHANLEQMQLRFSDLTDDSHSYHCIGKYKSLRILHVMPDGRSLSIDVILMLINQLPLLEKIEQTVDFANIIPWTADETEKFFRGSKQLMELVFVFEYKARPKFERSLNFIRNQFMGSDWIVETEERYTPQVFNTYGKDGMMQKQLIIRITRKPSI